jgi:D-cysteine desulfhydrase family pyridoxal phosphate-dependent enzyme
MNPVYPNRISLAQLPTPVEPLKRLSQHLGGPDIFIKRDDQTGLAMGGNKTRKLEFLVADALDQGCDHLITVGAAQSNHCRQTAAAASRLGLNCSLILRGDPTELIDGNLLLDKLLGARLRWSGDNPPSMVMLEIANELKAKGNKPYMIPRGGSNVIGATGYVLAMKELGQQMAEHQINIDFIVFASSSGGTQAGAILGAKAYGFQGRILGIAIDQLANELKNQIAALATATATHLGLGTVTFGDMVEVNDDYLGEDSGVMTEADRNAIRLVARLEGILLDPVYTGRAMAGLIDLIQWGAFEKGQNVLFWHTGGAPALFTDAQGLILGS